MSVERSRFSDLFKETHGGEQLEARRAKIASALEQIAQEHFEKRENLGTGLTSHVWKADLPEFKGRRCLKTMHTTGISVNTLEKEFALQEAFYKAGIPVPEPILFAQPDAKSGPMKNGVIAMEEIDGQTLEELIKELIATGEKMPLEEFNRIKETVRDIIKKCHENKLYHRDLKTKNIMITKSGEVKLIDLGDAVQAIGDDETEIYRAEVIQNGKPIIVVLPRDENVLAAFTQEMAKNKLVKAAA